jgi:hypothetical protein
VKRAAADSAATTASVNGVAAIGVVSASIQASPESG